uniref:Putative disease resistance protein RGA4 n=1 Tax=Aegilops tauschii TaxID=37682 RepID=R7W9F9_AEGTA
MEAAPAIAWLVQTILAALLIDKMEEWIRRVGLADDVEKLKSEIKRVKMAVSAVKSRGISNESLDESFALLKERLYEADDVVDELDYYRLQEQVQGGTPTARLPAPADSSVLIHSNFSVQGGTVTGDDEPGGMHGFERVDETSRGDASDSVGKLRSMVWEHFTITEKDNGKPVKAVCTHCSNEFKCDTKTNGTSSMRKHLQNEHSVTCTKKPLGAHPPDPSSSSIEPIVIASSSRTKGKRRRSMAWEHFDVMEEENEQPMKARCKYCPTQIKCGPKSGTAGMLNHYKICKDKPGPNEHPPNLSSTGDAHAHVMPILIGDSSTGKGRVDESARIIVDNTVSPWDKAELSNKIKRIASQLQFIRGEVSEILKLHGSDSPSCSDHHRSTTSDQHLRTSSLLPREVYGRVTEKSCIMKLIMTENRSDNVVVVPIVGIAGVGKTTLAQLVYNDPNVERQFHHRIWVSVSRNFDEIRITREMLSLVSPEKHEGIDCFVKLQEILKSHVKSKRVLLILDDVWEDKNDCRWNQLLAPFQADSANGNVILVTTRKFSVAKMIGTTGPIKLGALENDDFWLLFKSCAFGDANYESLGNLSSIGRQIAEELKGNALAAITAGALLRDHLTVDHWSNVLKKESWKSLGLSGGIMNALKISYDELPYNLQQCFSYCSIFPNKYQFLGKDLVYIWISQGFVNCTHFSKRLEETGCEYLNNLVNLGFFQQVEKQQEEDGRLEEEFSPGCQIWCSLANPLHVRYLKLELHGTVPQVLSTFFHLQVFDVGSNMNTSLPNGLHNLVSLRHLIAQKRAYSSIASIGKMTSIQELQDFEIQISSGFEITQLKSMSELVQLGVSQLDNVKTREEAYGAGLRNKEHLEELHLSWKDAYSEGNEYVSDTRSECSANMAREVIEGLEPHMDLKHLQICGYNGTTLPAWLANNISVTSLQTLHLHDCGGWRILPSLGSLPFLTKLKLSSMREVKEVLIPSLEELVLIEMPKLVRCSSTSVEGLCSSLRVLQIEDCEALKEFDLFDNNISFGSLQTLWLPSLRGWSLDYCPHLEVLKPLPPLSSIGSLRVLQIEDCEALKEFDLFDNDDNSGITQGSWLPSLRNLILDYCPHLEVLKPLPPSTTFCKVLIREVPRFPYMKVSSGEKLEIGNTDDYGGDDFDESSDELRILDDKTLAFHNLGNLKLMEINGCRNLRCFSFEGFSHLVSLTSLTIVDCKQLFSSDVSPEYTLEEVTAVNCNAFPSLKSLSIVSCGIAGKWLSLMLQHAAGLEELTLQSCAHITRVVLPMEEEENSQLTIVLSSANQDEVLTWLARDGLLHIPSNLVSSLKNITITQCPRLKFNWGKDYFSGFTSLEKLQIWGYSPLLDNDGSDDRANGDFFVFEKEDKPQGANGRWLLPTSLQELNIASFCYQETLQPCFPRDITSLKELNVRCIRGLQSLQLHSCTALEELAISGCGSVTVTVLEGMQPPGSLGHLNVSDCPGLPPYLDSISTPCPRLERLDIDDPSVLTTSFCKHLTSLQRLQLDTLEVTRLTDEQEQALVLIKSLKELRFFLCNHLVNLPAGLHTLPSLKNLEIELCESISRLPEAGLPRSLEELEIGNCSQKLNDECRRLATSKLKVKIDGRYVN